MKNQNPRKKGLVDIFVIMILLFVVSGIMMFVFNGGKQVDELTWDEFIQVIQTENVKEFSTSGVAGSGNEDAFIIQGIYTDEFVKANKTKGFTIVVTAEQRTKVLALKDA